VHTHILLGKGAQFVELDLRFANRHGLIAGATGTGKTVTLQTLAEGFSQAGVPVCMADVKGDLTGISQPGGGNARVTERATALGLSDHQPEACPAIVWDLLGQQGHPIRTALSEMGPLLIARLLELNDTQEGVIAAAFRLADDEGLLLLDLKDLRSLLEYLSENAAELRQKYGNIAPATVGTIQRKLLALQEQGGDHFFGEPALDLQDLMRTGAGGRGVINILAADKLMQSPRLYATFLLWLLAELFENLPEAGDLPKPKLVFFFDEAHLLFNDAPKPLVEKIEQVVRLIRSKGVGVYFVTQNPLDVPETVLGQLGNRVQHALRAYTPSDQRAVKAAAETFRANPAINTAQAITELAVGEALVSVLDEKGVPTPVDRILIAPPRSRLGPVNAEERRRLLDGSPVAGVYDTAQDRESAFEMLAKRSGATEAAASDGASSGGLGGLLGSIFGGGGTAAPAPAGRTRTAGRQKDSLGDIVMKSAVRSVATTIGSQVGRQIIRGVLGSLLKGR
jgi:DNA helicase HerA-like ATPase